MTQVNAELNADQISLPSLLGYFLSGAPDPISLNLTASAPPADIWSGRPFALHTFRETQGKVTLNAKAMKLSDALVVAGGRLEASLENGRLEVASLKGKALGGEFNASLSLTAKENAVAADARISLSGADLAQLPAPGMQPALLGQASLSLSAAGQGLSPRGLISVLRGRGFIRVSDGHLVKLTPVPVVACRRRIAGAAASAHRRRDLKKGLASGPVRQFQLPAFEDPRDRAGWRPGNPPRLFPEPGGRNQG